MENKLKDISIFFSFQFVETVNPDTLVRTVGANVPTLITARNVKVNVTVVKTAVMFQLDAQMSQKVSHVQYFFKTVSS